MRIRRGFRFDPTCVLYLPLYQIDIGRSANLLTNGDFEGGTTGWNAGSANQASEGTIVHSGSKSLKLMSNGTYSNSAQAIATYAKYAGITARLDGWGRPNSGNPQRSKLQLYDGVSYAASADFVDNDTWQSLSVSGKLSPSLTQLTSAVLSNKSGTPDTTGITYFDDMVLTVPQIQSRDAYGRICHPEGCIYSSIGGVPAYYLDGIDDLLTTESDFIGTSACTVMAWVKLSTHTVTARIIDNGKFAFDIEPTNHNIRCTNDGYVNTVGGAAGAIALSTWYHVTVTRTAAGVANLYINGQLSSAADQASGTPASGTTNVIVGNRLAGDRGLNGYLQELEVYNRVFSQPEIQNAMLATRRG